MCWCITDDSDIYRCPASPDPFLSVIQGEISCNTLRCRCVTDDPDTLSCLVSAVFFCSWLPTKERSHVTHFVLRVPLTTLNQPRLNRITRSRRKEGGYCGEHFVHNGCPKGIPGTNMHTGKVSRCAQGSVHPEGYKYNRLVPRQLIAYTPTQLRETNVVGTITA